MPTPTPQRNPAGRPPQQLQPRPQPKAPEPEPEEEQFEAPQDDQFDQAFSNDQAGEFDEAEGEGDEYDFDSMVLDLENVEDPKRIVFPPGTYPATIESVTPDVSQAKGNPMLVWQLQVTNPKTGESRGMRYYTVLTGDGAGRTRKTIKKVAPDTDLSAFRPSEADDLFSGLECRAVVKRGRYNGEPTNNVQDLLAPLGDFGR